MKKKTLKLHFTDMWGHGRYQFNNQDNYFYDLLSLKYNLVLDPVAPDILIYSCFGSKHKDFNCFKVFFSGENIKSGIPGSCINPQDASCSISFSKYPTTSINFYLPLWVLFVNWFQKYQPRMLPANPTYCNSLNDLTSLACQRSLKGFDQRKEMIFINNNFIKDRVKLFLRLQSLIHIDSYGKIFNNQNGPIRGSELDKHLILQNYRCTIALENSFYPGYITEKIIQPYAAGCIPIYRGGFDSNTFNPLSMILYDTYSNLDDLVNEVVSVCTNKNKWESYSKQPLFKDNQIPYQYTPCAVLDWLAKHL